MINNMPGLLVSRITGKAEVLRVKDIADIRPDSSPAGGSWITLITGNEIWVSQSSEMLNYLTGYHLEKRKVDKMLKGGI